MGRGLVHCTLMASPYISAKGYENRVFYGIVEGVPSSSNAEAYEKTLPV